MNAVFKEGVPYGIKSELNLNKGMAFVLSEMNDAVELPATSLTLFFHIYADLESLDEL